MADYPIASDLSYQVLQRRRRTRELTTPELDQANRRVHARVQQGRQTLRSNIGSFDLGQLVGEEGERPLTPIRDRHAR